MLTCSYVYKHSSSPNRTYEELSAAEERALLASSNLTPVLAIGSDSAPYAMSQNFPEKDAKIPVLAVKVAWSQILLASRTQSSSSRQDDTAIASSGIILRAHVTLLNKTQLRKHLLRNNGKIVVQLPGEHVTFPSGASLSRKGEVICFVNKATSSSN